MRKRYAEGLLVLSVVGVCLSQGTSPVKARLTAAAVKAQSVKRAASATPRVLRVYNWEDYILPDMSAAEAEQNGYDPVAVKGLNTRFEEYMATKGENVQVVYDRFDTNESMLNQLMAGRSEYDLICPSDYMIQRMMANDLLIPFDDTPVYDEYASRYLLAKIEAIKAKDVYAAKLTDPDATADTVPATAGVVQNYMRGYMWGTLGLLYNPDFPGYVSRGITAAEVEAGVQSWDVLWDRAYKSTATVKDSVRDTYAALIIETYKDEVKALTDRYRAHEIDADAFNAQMTAIFNRNDDATLAKVATQLAALRDNIYGYEVDSGKDDIQKGNNIGMGIAWSGDAVYAMDMADEAGQYTLRYGLPAEGSNIWFDGWVMTKKAAEHNNKDLAQAYVDFLSDPENVDDDPNGAPVVANMDYIGYTPFIAGDAVLDYVKSVRDMRADEDGELPGDDALPEGEEGTDYLVKDLSYFFADTVAAETDTKVYYLPEDRGRQLDAMYPDSDQLPYLMVMEDFGSRNEAVAKMWAATKALQFPIWGYVVIGVGVAALIGGVVFFQVKHAAVKKAKKKRRND